MDSYLSSLREIMAAVDGGSDDGASPSMSDARRGSHSTRAGGGGRVEEYSPSNPGLFAGFGCFPGATAGSPAPPDPFLSLLASSQAPSPGPSNASYHHHHATHEHHPDSHQHHPEPQQQQHAFDPALPSFHPAAADLQSPSSMFEWLLSAPVAEDFWDSSALDSFLAVAGGEADIGGGAGEGFEWMM